MQDYELLVGGPVPSSDQAAPLSLPPWARGAIGAHDWRDLLDRIVERCTDLVFPRNRQDDLFLETLAGSVAENVVALRDVLCGALTLNEVALNDRVHFATIQAELRIPQADLQRSYRMSFFLQLQEWNRVVMQAALEHDVDREEALSTQLALMTTVDAYADHVICNVVSTFAASEEAASRSRSHLRQRLVRAILEGDEEPLSPADLVILDYDLEAWHVAIVLPQVAQAAASQLLVRLRSTVRPAFNLVYPISMSGSVIWLGMKNKWAGAPLKTVIDTMENAGVVAALGGTHCGLQGFTRTYEQARQVDSLRAATPDQDRGNVVTYGALRLEILLLQNPALATEFVADELGALAEPSSHAAKLRATLDASFRLGSHVSTAEHLQLHEHTVRNRLQKAQELIGPLQERRTEIQVALRLHRILASLDGR